MKKIISLVMATVMLLTVMTTAISVSALETDTTAVGDSGTVGTISWYLDSDGTLTLSGNGYMPDFSYSSAPWCSYDLEKKVKTAIIGAGIKSIGSHAFYFNDNLKTVTFLANSSIEKIGKYAFAYTGIESIVLPSSVKTIDGYAFYYADSLTSISSNASVTLESHAISSCNNLTNVNLPKATFSPYSLGYDSNVQTLSAGTLKERALYGLSSLKTLNLTNAKSIGKYALHGCNNIRTVSSNATSVGDWAFNNCSSLQTVSLPKATSIGEYAFYQLNNLTTVKLGKVQNIKQGAFYECKKLTTVTGTSNLRTIGDYAFDLDTKLRNLSTSSRLTYIGDYSFSNCKALTGSINTTNVTYVGRYAFANCYNLKSTLVFKKVKTIEYEAFTNCKKIKCNSLGSKITKLGAYSFLGCSSVKSLYIPSCCKDVGFDSLIKNVTSCTVSSTGYLDVKYNRNGAKIAIYGDKGSAAQTHANIYKSRFYYAVKKITLNKTTAKIKVKKTTKIKVKAITPKNAKIKSVTFTSSNKKIATVSSKGVVKGVKKGTCYVYAKAKDGSGKSAKVKIIVK
ncbi:MAG: leucine-rich repeat domain-containing protein [Ruminococcus sp.]